MEDNPTGKQHRLDQGAHASAERRLRAAPVDNPEQVERRDTKTSRHTVEKQFYMYPSAAGALERSTFPLCARIQSS